MVYQSQSLPLSPPDRLPLIRGALLAGVLAIAGVGGGVAPPDLLLSQEQRTAYQQLMANSSQQPPGMAPLIAHVQAMGSLIAFFRFAASSGAVWLAYRLLVRSARLEEEEEEYQQQRALLSQANAQQLAASKQQELLLMQGELAGKAQFVEEVLAPDAAQRQARAYYAAQHGLSIEEYEAILAEEQANQEALEVEAHRVAVALEKQQAQAHQAQPVSVETPVLEAAVANSSPVDSHKADKPALPTNAGELMNRLASECPELLKLIRRPPIRLVGKQRTGKTTLAKIIVMLRVICDGHKLAWATPHREADNPIPAQFNPIGTTEDGGKNFPQIESLWKTIQVEIDRGKQLDLSVVWDEFGSYNFTDEQLLGKSLRSMLREASKHRYFPILIAHGDQASFYPGVTGILGTLKDSTIKVETIGEVANAFGEMKPTGAAVVTDLDGSETRFTIPKWLTEKYLTTLFPVDTRPSLLDNLGLNSLPMPTDV